MKKEQEQEIINLCQGLIRAKSYSGHERNAAGILESFFKNSGYNDTFIDEYGNVIGHIKGKHPGKTILFDGHIDTVPVNNPYDWKYDPFLAEIHDGRIYGRGASDMKGAVAAFACAAIDYAKQCSGDFNGDIYAAGVVHEECFEGVASRAVSKRVKPDYVVIGEASDLNIKAGQRGRAEIKLETFGVPAHSANPEKGINAVYNMCKLIYRIKKIEPPEHTALGKGIMELTDIKSEPYPGASIVPEHCTATYDRRLLMGETRESVLHPLQTLIESMKQQDHELKAKVSYAAGEERCYTGNTIKGERFFPGWLFDKNETFIADVVNELNQMGFYPEITQYNFCTNGSHYAGEAGIRTIGFGPSTESLAHTIDEYIEIDQLIKAAQCYCGIIKALL